MPCLYPVVGYAYGCNPVWSRGEKFVRMYIWSYVIPCCVVRPITHTTVGGREGGKYIYDCVCIHVDHKFV